MKKTMKMLTILCVGGLLTACGGGGINSGVDGNKQIKDVTPAEATQFCEAAAEYTKTQISDDEMKSFSCYIAGQTQAALAGLTGGDPKMLCEMGYEECMKQPAMSNTDTDCTGNKDGNSMCTATVAEIEACTEERILATKELLSSFNCDSMGTEVQGLESGPACSALAKKCPTEFGNSPTQQ